MRIHLTVLATLAAATLVASAGAAPRPLEYVLPGNAVFPEGIAFDEGTGSFYVGSTSDGSILRGHVNEPVASPFAPGVTGSFSTIGLDLDGAGRLYAAGGSTGTARVYDATTAALIRTFTSGAGGFLNDLAVAKTGDVFVTDSFRPVLWRIPAAAIVPSATPAALDPWLDFTGTPLQYTAGFNANGIVATPDGKYLVVSQSNTGELFRIDLATKEVVQIDLGGEAVNGDGIELRGRTLYAAANGSIVKVALAGDLSAGEVISRTGDPSFSSPTTIAIARGRLLVVNSQFDRLFGGLPPELPFTVSSIAIP